MAIVFELSLSCYRTLLFQRTEFTTNYSLVKVVYRY